MADPPVVVTGGSIIIKLNSPDFPGAPREIKSNVKITSIMIEDENGQKQTINVPQGKFTVTFNQ